MKRNKPKRDTPKPVRQAITIRMETEDGVYNVEGEVGTLSLENPVINTGVTSDGWRECVAGHPMDRKLTIVITSMHKLEFILAKKKRKK